jgi:hypothetical protein
LQLLRQTRSPPWSQLLLALLLLLLRVPLHPSRRLLLLALLRRCSHPSCHLLLVLLVLLRRCWHPSCLLLLQEQVQRCWAHPSCLQAPLLASWRQVRQQERPSCLLLCWVHPSCHLQLAVW